MKMNCTKLLARITAAVAVPTGMYLGPVELTELLVEIHRLTAQQEASSQAVALLRKGDEACRR
jgi:hypothetical protein